MVVSNAYDEVPYRSVPIVWTAPERLALTSLLHGGPVPRLGGCAMLELGCGDGANILALAADRPDSRFVGVDGSGQQVHRAMERRTQLGLSNIEFIHSDFRELRERTDNSFDYIVGHGIISWIADKARDDLLAFCKERLRPGGLLYLNYNARPGWTLRGMVREFLLAQTAGSVLGLAQRAERSREISSRVLAALPETSHPYSRLLTDEFRIVAESPSWYIAHEYLAPDNRAYWCSEFMALASAHGFEHVADADFDHPSGRLPDELGARLVEHDIAECSVDNAIDLLCYRQMRFPILTPAPFTRRRPEDAEFLRLWIASNLTECVSSTNALPVFLHPPTGYEVEARTTAMAEALRRLQAHWPTPVRIASLFDGGETEVEDLKLLYRSGLVDLHLSAPDNGRHSPDRLTAINL